MRQANDPRVEVVTSPIIGEALTAISSEYRAILDVGYASQKGLSFRFFDALGYEQKLISNNQTVKQYPFYHAENIHCIDETHLQVPPSFLQSAYHRIPDEIKQRYRLDTWVKNLLTLMTRDDAQS